MSTGMQPPDLEAIAARLADPKLGARLYCVPLAPTYATGLADLRARMTILTELRDLVDTFKDADITRYISSMLPIMLDLLNSAPPAFRKDALEHQFRHTLIELIHRHPAHEAYKPFIQRAAQTMLRAVRIDNEDGTKGVHFNAKNQSDTKDKLASVIESTVSLKPADRTTLFEQYLHALENISEDTIWRWWQTGKKPTH